MRAVWVGLVLVLGCSATAPVPDRKAPVVAAPRRRPPTSATGCGRWLPRSEAGLGIRKDGASVHFVVGARTIWSNPDDVVRKLLAIPSGDLLSGKAIEAGASIASAAPGSPFAHDLRAGLAGFMSLSVSLGMLVGIGTPAWVDRVRSH